MQDAMSFLDRKGEFRQEHIITIRHLADSDNTEQVLVELSGMDTSVIIGIGGPKLDKLIRELMKARSEIDIVKHRKRRELLSALRMTESEAKEAGIDLGPLFSESKVDS